MARIAGIDLPRDKRIDVGLTYIFGIGRMTSARILGKAGVDGSIRVKDLSEDQIVKLRETIDRDHEVEGDLRKDRKSTRLNSSHLVISYAVFCSKKKTANA